jgi:hypothetical protein
MKRTSTDAGFNHTSDAHDAKMSRSHTPGMMHVRPSTTGATARKGMEDLKSRLSKIQRESAMHERVHHHPSGPSAEAPLNTNPRSSLVTHTNAPSFSKALPSAVPTATGSTFAINHVAATEKLDRDSTTEIRSHPQHNHRDFSAPIELSASSKIQTAHPLTEPINPQSRVAILEPAASSKNQHEDLHSGPRSGQSSETETKFQNKQTSSSNLIGNMLVADEGNSKSLTAEARISPLTTGAQYTGLSSPSEVASVLPTTKIETKHLAFLKGAIGASTSPPPSTELEKSTRNPLSRTVDPASHSVGSEHDDPQPRAGTEDEEDEDCQSVASSKLSQQNEMDDQHENSNLSSEDNEDHEKHSEAEDDASNDDDTYGEPSVEIVSSHAKRILTNSDHEQDLRNRQESNVVSSNFMIVISSIDDGLRFLTLSFLPNSPIRAIVHNRR